MREDKSGKGRGEMIEYCFLCNEPTGNAGRLDDSIVCEICGHAICEKCIHEKTPRDNDGEYVAIWCKDCGKKQKGAGNVDKGTTDIF